MEKLQNEEQKKEVGTDDLYPVFTLDKKEMPNIGHIYNLLKNGSACICPFTSTAMLLQSDVSLVGQQRQAMVQPIPFYCHSGCQHFNIKKEVDRKTGSPNGGVLVSLTCGTEKLMRIENFKSPIEDKS